MWKGYNRFIVCGVLLMMMGCAVHMHRGRPSDVDKIKRLSGEVGGLEGELARLEQMRAKERQELEKAKALLSKLLQKEIDEKQVRVEQNERGLVITFLAEVLFDSGRAKIREDAYSVLDKITKVLSNEVKEYKIGIEGHTDNEPIKYSGWKSNWELSTARATSVLHYLVDERQIEPTRVSAIGYGEFHPIADNNIEEGKQQNRRVEVVVLPKEISKIRAGLNSTAIQKMVQKERQTPEEKLSQEKSSNPYIK